MTIKDFENRFASVETFLNYLNEFAGEMNEYICSLIPSSNDSQKAKYLYAPFADFCKNGGKCSRPLTCLLGALAAGGNIEKAMRCAAAIELFQDAALVHDDIADEATTRRSKPCLHITQGVGNALNAGDLGLILVDDLVLKDNLLSEAETIVILHQLFNMKLRTIEGQAIDLGWSRDERYDLTVNDYYNMATHKTAYYTCAYPLLIGAYTSDTVSFDPQNLFEFGLKCGLAFQIKDDLLNITNESTKDFALDITEGKRTLMVIHALSSLEEPCRDRLICSLKSKTTDEQELKFAISLIERAGSIEFAQREIEKLVSEAEEILTTSVPKSHARDILEDMAKWCAARTN